MKMIFKIVRKVIMSFGIIYTLDLILSGADIFIPINIASISVGTILGPFGIIGMIIVMLVSK